MARLTKQINCTNCDKRSSCFNELSKSDHIFIEENRLELKFKKGEVICKQGAFASNIMFVYEGLGFAYLETEEGNRIGLNIIPPGKMIGLPSLFTDNVFKYSAVAIEDCMICSVDIRVFENFTKSNGGFASEIIRTLNSCMIHMFERIESLTYKQMHGRIADTLLYLSEEVYKSPKFVLSLSRKDLADLTAMSPESVTRIMNGFSHEGIIHVTSKTLEIKKMSVLKRISQTS